MQRDARQYGQEPGHVADAATLAALGFHVGVGVDSRVKSARTRNQLDTLQRNGPFGNMLEIVDVRPEASQQRCGRAGCTCTGVLRAGWAAQRVCQCSEASALLNCRDGGIANTHGGRHEQTSRT